MSRVSERRKTSETDRASGSRSLRGCAAASGSGDAELPRSEPESDESESEPASDPDGDAELEDGDGDGRGSGSALTVRLPLDAVDFAMCASAALAKLFESPAEGSLPDGADLAPHVHSLPPRNAAEIKIQT